MERAASRLVALGVITMSLSACGGGGGYRLASTPMQIPIPMTIPPSDPLPPFGLKSDTTFATAGANVEFRWVDSAKAYEIQFAGQQLERLGLIEFNPTIENHYPGSGLYFISIMKDRPYQYTNLAIQRDNAFGGFISEFAFGIPTAVGDVPVTGSASYAATIFGDSLYPLSGDAKLSFNFGAGSLTGYMRPTIWTGTESRDLGQYDFTQTVYSTGSTTFSGKFIVPGGGSTADSGFDGRFTGPQGAEVMAAFHAPFRDPYSDQWRNMSGLWIGKKD